MTTRKQATRRERRQLDAKLAAARLPLLSLQTPRAGWLRAIRTSLGMTADQLAGRLGVTRQSVLLFEKGELKGTISLATLRKVAAAMRCQVVYALLPEIPLEELIDERARAVAKRMLERTRHSMALEGQSASVEADAAQLEERVATLTAKLPPKFWG